MTTARSIVCGSCGADVPYGRLSCPSCGDLLASVAGGTRVQRAAAAEGSAAAVTDPAAGLMPDAPAPPPPGAYVPPPIVGGSVAAPDPRRGSLAAVPAGPAAPARAWGPAPRAAGPVAEAAGDAGPGTAARPGPLAAERRAESIGWLAIAGGALAAVGFLLPWGVSIIGATGTDYLARWGLAGPFHPIVVLVILAVVAGAILPNPVPAWLRLGVPATIAGILTVGLVWPYLFGFSTAGPGAIAAAVGATLFAGAGLASLIVDRHARVTSAV